MPAAPTREQLRDHLVATRIAGPVRTPVWSVLRNAELVAAGDPGYSFGLSGLDRLTPAAVLAEVERQFGWSHQPGAPQDGGASIDPDLLIDELDRAAERLARAARNGEHVVLATGHPTGVLALYQQLAQALRAAGAKVERYGDGLPFPFDGGRKEVRYVNHVATMSSGADLLHTHASMPMELLLAQAGPIDLVVADHGWAGAAAERGYDVIGIADINDPALAMAKADGRAAIVLPMDDNVLPSHYDLVGEYLTARLPWPTGTRA